MTIEQRMVQPTSGFAFEGSNEAQKEAIITTEGPVLVLAGPGTGKTHTLVKRIAYLLLDKHVKPSQLFVATFTDKAAKELVTRLSNELPDDFVFNPDEMYLGTFHSLCLRLIREYADVSDLPKSFKTVESSTLDYLLLTNLDVFWQLRDEDGNRPFVDFLKLFKGEPDRNDKYKSNMWKVWKIKSAVSAAAEEGVSPETLLASGDADARVVGVVYAAYEQLLADNGLLDFGKMQLACLRMLKKHPKVLANLQEKLSFFLIDEYQDTNRVQEEMLFLLARKSRNIFVVGDDDQGLYRFRGATVRNILDFEERARMRLGASQCKVFRLEENYRSEPQIIDFCNRWMSEIRVPRHSDFSWEEDSVSYRAQKNLVPGEKRDDATRATTVRKGGAKAVYKILGRGAAWRKSIIELIKTLKNQGIIHDYNQIAFLTFSTTSQHCLDLQEGMERAGIGVYSPRSGKFFSQTIIKQLFGMLLQLFRDSATFALHTICWDKDNDAPKDEYAAYVAYAEECMDLAQKLMDADKSLKDFVTAAQKRNRFKFAQADYGYTDMLYETFAFEPFKGALSIDLRSGIEKQRDLRNEAKFMQLLAAFESLVNVDKLCDTENPSSVTCRLFSTYFHYLYDSGVKEYEDDVEYAPGGCVSFLTIHQSKGLEFPVVIVDVSAAGFFRDAFPTRLDKIVKGTLGKRAWVSRQASCHDFWRLYYTAFSRAQNLLVVTQDEDAPQSRTNYVTTAFDPYMHDAGADALPAFDPAVYTGNDAPVPFADVKANQLKPVFSFTTHFGLYESCPRRYKFYRELGFPSKRGMGMHFGTVVHQTIEDVNNAILAGKGEKYVRGRMAGWLNANCAAIELSEKTTFDKLTRGHAFVQVNRYVGYYAGRWDELVAAEMPISLARKRYIAKGSIDLVKHSHDDDSLVLVDFKTGKKPNADNGVEDGSQAESLLKRYREQLNMYASLISSQKDEDGNNISVSFTQLYYVGADDGEPTVTFECTEEGTRNAQENFDEIAERIIEKDFDGEADDLRTCARCDFRFYCGKARL